MTTAAPPVPITPLVQPLKSNASAILNKPTVQPCSILAKFDWLADYGAGTANPNVNVLVNCLAVQGAGAQAPIDSIRSVKIDNTGNAYAVYVTFPDTTDAIVAPANTMVWEPVVTNQPIANIYLIGAQDAGLGTTNVYFCNFFVPPYVNAEISQAVALAKASPIITLAGTGASVSSIEPINPGSWYNNGNLTVSGNATAVGILDEYGRFISTEVTNGGDDYNGQPVITASGGQTAPALWNNHTNYPAGTFVNSGGLAYQARVAVPLGGTAPPSNPTEWTATGISATPVTATFQAVLTNSGTSAIVNNSPYGPETLGDQADNIPNDITGTGIFEDNLWGTPYGSGYIYLKGIDVRLLNNPNADTEWALQNSNDVSLFDFVVSTGPQQLLNLQGMNVKLDATLTWSLTCTVHNANAIVSHGFCWTYGT